MSKKDMRRQVWSLMWKDLRLDYLLVSFAIALAAASVVDDILSLLIGGNGIGPSFRYALAAVVTVAHVIARMIWERRSLKEPDAGTAE